MYHDKGYRGAMRALSSGKTINTADRVDKIYIDGIKERNEAK